MKTILSSDSMDIPGEVSIKIHAKIIEVEGPRGKLTKDFKHLNLDFQLTTDESGQKKLKIDSWFGSRKSTAAIRTALSHVSNLIIGVTKGYRYKMRMVYAHFPINASIAGSSKAIEIRNFLGEKKVRKVDMLDGVTITRSEKVKDELVLDGNDIELVSRSAALINQAASSTVVVVPSAPSVVVDRLHPVSPTGGRGHRNRDRHGRGNGNRDIHQQHCRHSIGTPSEDHRHAPTRPNTTEPPPVPTAIHRSRCLCTAPAARHTWCRRCIP